MRCFRNLCGVGWVLLVTGCMEQAGRTDGGVPDAAAQLDAKASVARPVAASLAVGDFNGDHKLDVVATNYAASNVTVLLGDGAGGFSQPVHYFAGMGPLFVAVGDLNGDHSPDLAVADFQADVVSVLLGDGTGGFAAPSYFITGSEPSWVTIGDFNGDLLPDLAVANSRSGSVTVLKGDGNGRFAAVSNKTVRTDFVTSDYHVSGHPDYRYTGAAGDFDGDGKLDLVVDAGQLELALLPGDGTGGFGSPSKAPYSFEHPMMAPGDFNSDGKLDFVVHGYRYMECWHISTCRYYHIYIEYAIEIYFNNGARGFTMPSSALNYSLRPDGVNAPIAVADLNGDKMLDLVVGSSKTNLVELGDGTGKLPNVKPFFSQGSSAVALGDFNGDGNLDSVIMESEHEAFGLFLGDGAGGLAPFARYPIDS